MIFRQTVQDRKCTQIVHNATAACRVHRHYTNIAYEIPTHRSFFRKFFEISIVYSSYNNSVLDLIIFFVENKMDSQACFVPKFQIFIFERKQIFLDILWHEIPTKNDDSILNCFSLPKVLRIQYFRVYCNRWNMF